MFHRCSRTVFVLQRMLLISIALSIGIGGGFACGGACCEDPLESEHAPAEAQRSGCFSSDLAGIRCNRRSEQNVASCLQPVDWYARPVKLILRQGFSLAFGGHRLANGLCAPLRC